MKVSAIIRIILWSMIAVLLCAVLLGCLSGYGKTGFFSLNNLFPTSLFFEDTDDENGEYLNGGASIPWEAVHRIEVDWVGGEVQVEVYEGNEIIFEEDGATTEERELCYLLQDGALTIRFEQKQSGWNWFSFSPDKVLQLKIPRALLKQLREIKIETASAIIRAADVQAEKIVIESVSGNIELKDMAAQILELESVSGKINCTGGKAEQLKAENTSGKLQLQGAFEKVKAENVSGEIYLQMTAGLQEFEGNSVSGNITLSLPEIQGFTAEVETVSGSFVSDYSTALQENYHIHGNGASEYDFETVSGNIYIKKQG